MKYILLTISACIVLVACAEKQAAKPVRTTNPATIAKADEAFRELDAEVSPKPRPPQVQEKPKPPIVEEKPKEPEKPVYQDKARPEQTADKAKPSAGTKYPFKNGYPVWVLSPDTAGCAMPAVGSAKPQQGGFYAQKRAAEMQARAELARMISLKIDNEIATERYVTTKGNSQDSKSNIEIYSRQRSNELLSSVKEVDSWLDKGTNDYYVLLCADK